MKFSYQWISELVPGLTLSPEQLERLITMKTAECEGIERFGADAIIEIDNKSLTHRPDLWGHYGMAREVAAINDVALIDPVDLRLLPASEGSVRVEITDLTLCPRYSALRVENIQVDASPEWLKARLASIGLNPINNIVDLTNYILSELPQPMHAFDADKLQGDTIFVRSARAGEKLAALNGEIYELALSDLVIADAAGPIALAGVIGGSASAISESTTRVVFESANFSATSVRLSSARHKLRTDASMRFEKAQDPENTVRGLARAIALLKALSPDARIIGGVADVRAERAEPPVIIMPVSFVSRKLGKQISRAEIKRILTSLGFTVEGSDVLTVTVPSWRATKDISIKDDLVEEIGRIIGYGEITPAPPLVASTVPPANPARTYARQIRSQLTAQGFTEVSNYSFVSEADFTALSLEAAQHIGVRNPIAAEQTHLRTSLLPGLLKNIVSNVRNFREFRIFELGSEIHSQPGSRLPLEIPHAAAVLYNQHGSEEDFFEMKRVVECLFRGARVRMTEPRPYEHPVRTAIIEWHASEMGRIFELHPSLLQAAGVQGRAVVFDVDLELAGKLAASQTIRYQPLRKYPTSGFDLSVVTPLQQPVASIEDDLRTLGGTNIVLIDFVRQYSGSPLAEGMKSVSYHIEVGAADRTLTADEAGEIRGMLIEGMRARGYELRV